MKKLFFVLTAAIISFAGFSVFASETYITADPTVCGCVGDSLSVCYEISKNDICLGSITISYDKELLKLVEITPKSALSEVSPVINQNGAKIGWSSIKAIKSGELLEVSFEVISDKKAVSEISFNEEKTYFGGYDETPREVKLPKVSVYLNGMFLESGFYQNEKEVTSVLKNSTVKGKCGIYNIPTEDNITVYLGEYKADGELIKLYSANNEGKNKLCFEVDLNVSKESEKLKIIIFNGNLKPLKEAEICLVE